MIQFKVKESDIQRAILEYLQYRPDVFIARNNTGVAKVTNDRFYRFGLTGWPDIIGTWRGKFLGIEVKVPGGKLSSKQKETIDRLRSIGATIIVATSVDEVTDVLGYS